MKEGFLLVAVCFLLRRRSNTSDLSLYFKDILPLSSRTFEKESALLPCFYIRVLQYLCSSQISTFQCEATCIFFTLRLQCKNASFHVDTPSNMSQESFFVPRPRHLSKETVVSKLKNSFNCCFWNSPRK